MSDPFLSSYLNCDKRLLYGIGRQLETSDAEGSIVYTTEPALVKPIYIYSMYPGVLQMLTFAKIIARLAFVFLSGPAKNLTFNSQQGVDANPDSRTAAT